MDRLKNLKSQLLNKKSIGESDGNDAIDMASSTAPEKSGNTASAGEIIIFAITQCLKILILFVGLALFIIMLPIFPFLWVSYKGFHGKYGIIKLFRENYNVYQL